MRDLYRILAELEKGAIPWVKPCAAFCANI